MKIINCYKNKFEKYFKDHPLSDETHNIYHLKRVWKNALNIMDEKADELIILAASYFHDLVIYPKNHMKRSASSKESALKAEEILLQMEFPKEKINGVKHAIMAHSFSAGILPETIEAKIVQDADRLEALGAIGLARTFYVAGTMGIRLFNEDDPLAKDRELDDRQFALDHFKVKLLKLPETMQTEKGRFEAQKRALILSRFIENLMKEIL